MIQYNYFLKISDEVIVLNSFEPIVFPESYLPFICNQKCKQPLFSVNISFNTELLIKEDNLLMQQRTYLWSTRDNKIYFTFTKRNSNVESDAHPWVIEISNNICNLYIPNRAYNNDLFDRPWLHRLFSYFLPVNKILSHGGCFEIDGKGCLILGECGKGKSTFLDFVAQSGYRVLCDDRILLDFGSDIVCYSTPWNLKNPHIITLQPSKVSAIVFLEHSDTNHNELQVLVFSKSIKKIVSQFYLPIPKNQLQSLVLCSQKLRHYNLKIWNYNFLPNMESVEMLANAMRKPYEF